LDRTNRVAISEWERVAVSLHADPRPGLLQDSNESPFSSTYTVNWMIDGLTPQE
jgi:hypothetical protein